MISFLKLIRYKNLLMVLLTMVLSKYALINPLVNSKYVTDYQFVILLSSVLLITAGGYIINDIFDVKTDVINKPKKVILGTFINLNKAKFLYFFITIIGLSLGVYLALTTKRTLLIGYYVACVASLFFYSYKLKRVFLLGNIIVAILCFSPILLTYFFHYEYTSKVISNEVLLFTTIIAYSFFAFLTTFIREIVKDIEDVDGDLKIHAKTLPIIIGRKRATKVAFFLSCILFLFLLFVVQMIFVKKLFFMYGLVLVILPLLYFMYLLWFAEKKKDFSKLSILMKGIMLLGTLSMLFFKYV